MTKKNEALADIERHLLAGILMAPDRLFEVEEHVTPEYFQGAGRRTIFKAMLTLHRRNADVDVLTLKDEIERARGAPVTGISVALTKLFDYGTSDSHVLHHARLLKSRYALDQLSTIADGILNDGPSIVPNEESVGSYLDEVMTSMYGLTGKIEQAKQTDLASQMTAALKKIRATDGGVTGIRTGLTELDEIMHGLRPGQLIICGARPSMGKSALATSIVMNAAGSSVHEFARRAKCCLISLEMSTQQIIYRMLCSRSGVKGDRLFQGLLNQDEEAGIAEAAEHIRSLPLVIDDSPSLTVHRLRGLLRRIKQQEGLDLVVIDYIQLLRAAGKHESRQIEVSVISRELKALARELEVPILALCQLSRAAESHDRKRPMLSDLRESGSIEQDADVVLLLYREPYYYDNDVKNIPLSKAKAEVIVAKNREGATGSVDLFFRAEQTRFDSCLASDGSQAPMVINEEVLNGDGQEAV